MPPPPPDHPTLGSPAMCGMKHSERALTISDAAYGAVRAVDGAAVSCVAHELYVSHADKHAHTPAPVGGTAHQRMQTHLSAPQSCWRACLQQHAIAFRSRVGQDKARGLSACLTKRRPIEGWQSVPNTAFVSCCSGCTSLRHRVLTCPNLQRRESCGRSPTPLRQPQQHWLAISKLQADCAACAIRGCAPPPCST
jgi:hypothetical protein